MTGMLQYVLFNIWLLSLIVMFVISIYVFLCSYSMGIFIFIYYAIPYIMLFLLIPSTIVGHQRGFKVGVPVKYFCENSGILFFWCRCEHISVGQILRHRNVVSFGRHLFRFIDNCRQIFKMVVQVFTLSIVLAALHPHQCCDVVSLLNSSYCGECMMAYHYDLIYFSFIFNNSKCLLIFLLAIWINFFVNCPFKSFTRVLDGLSVFFLFIITLDLNNLYYKYKYFIEYMYYPK